MYTCDITTDGCIITISTLQFLISACKNGGERPGKVRYAQGSDDNLGAFIAESVLGLES